MAVTYAASPGANFAAPTSDHARVIALKPILCVRRRSDFMTNRFLALATAGVGCLSPLSGASGAGGTCDLTTVRGTYALHISGSNGTGPFTPLVGEAISVFDGAGHVWITYGYGAVGGAAAVKFTGSGAYNVQPDCSIYINGVTSPGFSVGDHFGLVQDFGNTINAIRTNPGATVTLNFSRTAP
jgi:hypothetical protein